MDEVYILFCMEREQTFDVPLKYRSDSKKYLNEVTMYKVPIILNTFY